MKKKRKHKEIQIKCETKQREHKEKQNKREEKKNKQVKQQQWKKIIGRQENNGGQI